MTDAARPTLVAIPDGRLVDYVTGALLAETAEEVVRQNLARALHEEYRYPRSELAIEFPIRVGVSRKRLDIAIFREGAEPSQTNVYGIVETKAPSVPKTSQSQGVDQLKSYLASCPNAAFGVWTNGADRIVYQRVTRGGVIEFDEEPDFPAKGQSFDDLDAARSLSIKPASGDNLRYTFKRCHNYVAGNQGIHRQAAFWELLKLIFVKIADEQAGTADFRAATNELRSRDGHARVKARLDKAFRTVIASYPGLFRTEEAIDLNPAVLAYCVSQLQGYDLLRTPVDVKGVAYEEIVGSTLRGDRGEFFTPRNVVKMAVGMLGLQTTDRVMDPACGTGGFLVVAMNELVGRFRAHNVSRARPLPEEALYRGLQALKEQQVTGIDFNPDLVKATRMNMAMNNDGQGGLFAENSLKKPVEWSDEARARVGLRQVGGRWYGEQDAVLTNPPFGSNIRIDDPQILGQFDLARRWRRRDDDLWSRDENQFQASQPPEILFIERCWQLLKPGTGRMAIVVPDGILGDPGLGYVRQWILTHAQVLASIDLPVEMFLPFTGTQTSVLFLRRKSYEEIDAESRDGARPYAAFMAQAERVGHDRRGNTLYLRDADGREIVEQQMFQATQVVDGQPVDVQEIRPIKIVDDDLPRIAEAYNTWLTGYSRAPAREPHARAAET
ncbi:MAG: N-6 DNA methylase [Chloroflexi bacterium]|nr:N-6 DNA methylase [Chloroflexota bacterium]